jgi:hypothetical protein
MKKKKNLSCIKIKNKKVVFEPPLRVANPRGGSATPEANGGGPTTTPGLFFFFFFLLGFGWWFGGDFLFG